jgi:sec-independent protein translocase protein TatB
VFNLGMGEITVILLLALIFLGPKKLPELATGLGKLIRDIRKATSDVKNEIALDDTFRKPFEELRDAVTLHPDELKRRDEIRKSMDETRKKMEQMAADEAAAADPNAGPSSSGAPSTPMTSTPSGSVVPPPPVTSPTPPPPPIMSSAPPPGPVFPTAPPTGTFPRHSTPPVPPRIGGSRVTPPVSHLATEQANKTQSLSEADLLTPPPAGSAPSTHKPPPPPPPPVRSSLGLGADKKKTTT